MEHKLVNFGRSLEEIMFKYVTDEMVNESIEVFSKEHGVVIYYDFDVNNCEDKFMMEKEGYVFRVNLSNDLFREFKIQNINNLFDIMLRAIERMKYNDKN